jgi:hypothetical protein
MTKCFDEGGLSMGEVTAIAENENDQQDLQDCMNEAAFSNFSTEDYINIDKDGQTEPDMDTAAFVQNFRESRKGREEKEEDEIEKK